jgi:hypothetical protein
MWGKSHPLTLPFYNSARRKGVTSLTLIIRYTAKSLEFLFKTNQDHEVTMSDVDRLCLTGYDFVGPVIGLLATADEEVDSFVTFRELSV